LDRFMETSQPRIAGFVSRNTFKDRDLSLSAERFGDEFTGKPASFEVVGADEACDGSSRLFQCRLIDAGIDDDDRNVRTVCFYDRRHDFFRTARSDDEA